MREWDFFFIRFCFFVKFGSLLSLLKWYNRSIYHRPSFLVYLVVWSLYTMPVRLLSLPPFYLRIGVPDPYLGCQLISQFVFRTLGMCHSGFNSSSQSEEEQFDSGDPSTSLSNPSIAPSDRGSEGRPSVWISSEGASHRFYKIPDSESSESESEESVLAELTLSSLATALGVA